MYYQSFYTSLVVNVTYEDHRRSICLKRWTMGGQYTAIICRKQYTRLYAYHMQHMNTILYNVY